MNYKDYADIEDAAALIVKAAIDILVKQGKDKFILEVSPEHYDEFTRAAKWLGLEDRCLVRLDPEEVQQT